MNKNDQIQLFPSLLNGNITIPPSKSISHRAIICAGLSEGESTISNIVFSEDINATIEAMEAIGASIKKEKDKLYIKGIKRVKTPKSEVNCNESGSTLRFMIPILSLSKRKVIVTGKESLLKRPLSLYEHVFKLSGSELTIKHDTIVVNGSIKANDYILDGDISSQFFSGLMFALPTIKEDSTITINGKLESKSYIDLTIDVLDQFGIEIKEIENGYFIEGNQKYMATDYKVEGDYSQAAFFLSAGTFNESISIHGLNHESLQGDMEIIDILQSMKAKIIFEEEGYISTFSSTKGTTIDLSNCPDLGPILALMGALSTGTTKLINAERLKIKESDRISSTVTTLKKLGANIESTDDTITIKGRKWLDGDVSLDSYNDHRIAMMIAIAATKCKKPIILTNPGCVNKSYPGFFDDYKSIGGKFK